MAVYQPPSRRRRLSYGLAIAALVIGLLAGVGFGRLTAPTVDDKVDDARASARDLVAGLRVLPLEYEQAASGSSETAQIEDTVERAAAQLPGTLEAAPWLSRAQRRSARAAVGAIETSARAHDAPARFEATTQRSVTTLQSIFGLPASGAG